MSVLNFCVKTLFYGTLPIFQSSDKIQQSNQKHFALQEMQNKTEQK